MSSNAIAFSFGSFDYFCNNIALTLCPLVGPDAGIEPTCYARNVELGGTLIFEPATLLIYLMALVMTSIMIYNIKAKYTAVGRKEIVMFFYIYALTILVELLLVSGIIPTASAPYQYFVAIHVALGTTACWILFLNGFVGFQWAEDGTPLSLWSIRISSAIVFVAVFFVSIATFIPFAGFSRSNPVALFVIYYVFNLIFIATYVVLQVVLVLNTLDDRWPLGDILFGFAFFLAAQIFQYVVNDLLCQVAKHYVDGLFFGTICTLLAVMMVYKYWDSITKEDLEFSVGGRTNVWEIKEPLLNEGYTGY